MYAAKRQDAGAGIYTDVMYAAKRQDAGAGIYADVMYVARFSLGARAVRPRSQLCLRLLSKKCRIHPD